MGCEDMKTEDCTRVRTGLSLVWKASLVINYVDSFLCNQLHVTLDLSGVYKTGEHSPDRQILIIIVIHARLLGFSHYDLVVDQLL